MAIFLLLAIFFALYYLYYIPYNQSRIHQYGFLLLDRIQSNIIERDDDLQRLYHNTVQTGRSQDTVSLARKLQSVNPKPTVITSPRLVLCSAESDTSGNDEFAYFGELKGWQRIYGVTLPGTGMLKLGIPIDEFLNPCFSYKKELFESYMLTGSCQNSTVVLFQDATLGIASNKRIDTLLTSGRGKPFPQIIDINIKGTAYKMFTSSFQLMGQDVTLCGFVKRTTYGNRLNIIPINLVYPIITIFLLLIIFLPFIKIFLMSAHEHMQMSDFVFAILSLFLGATMITIITIQLLLLTSANEREKISLKKLSAEIEEETNEEIEKAYKQLLHLDSALSSGMDDSSGLLVSSGKTQYRLPITSRPKDPSGYYFFDRISWINKDGRQVIKGQIDNPGTMQMIDVSDRKYFQVFKKQERWLAGNAIDGEMGFEPIFSWTEGNFKINLSIRSRIDSLFVASISTRMYSLVQTVFPPGYGYCLIDADGTTLTHSEMSRNLKENFLDETGQLQKLKEAIVSRQNVYLNTAMLYGKQHAVYIHPLKKIPLFLVTFYDNNYYIPVNLRILSFSLLFSAFVYLIVLILILLLRRTPYRSFVFGPIDYFQWIVPRNQLSRFYVRVFVFITAYIFLLLIGGVRYGILRDYVVFFITLLTPLNILTALYIFRVIEPDKTGKLQGKFPWKVFLLLLLLLVTSILVYFGANLYSTKGSQFYIWFQGLVIITLCGIAILYLRSSKTVNLTQIVNSNDFLFKYSLCVTSLVACLAALPAGIFTWYAHTLELSQSLKKSQLHMINSLKQRQADITNFLQFHDTAWFPRNYQDTVLYKKGFYTLYNDEIYCVSNCSKINIKEDTFNTSENFYLKVADWVGGNYNDPLYYPALYQRSSDGYWHWKKSQQNDSLYFSYSLPSSPGVSAIEGLKDNTIIMRSLLPQRYMILQTGTGKFLIFVFVCLVLAGLFRLIRNTTYRFFMFKYINAQQAYVADKMKHLMVTVTKEDDDEPAEAGFLINSYAKNAHRIDPLRKVKRIGNSDSYDVQNYFKEEYKTFKLPESLVQAEKQEILLLQEYEYWELFYNDLWNKCNDEEKFLMMDLAKEGLMNYKRSSVIYSLLQKQLIIINNNRLSLFSLSFRYFILKKKGTPDELDLQKKFNVEGTWSAFRTPFLLIILGMAVFIFFTQEETSRQIIALITSLTTLIPLLFKLLSGSTDMGVKK
jgi:hypothetical protein